MCFSCEGELDRIKMLETILTSLNGEEKDGGNKESQAGGSRCDKEEGEEEAVELCGGIGDEEKFRDLAHLSVSVSQNKCSHSLQKIITE